MANKITIKNVPAYSSVGGGYTAVYSNRPICGNVHRCVYAGEKGGDVCMNRTPPLTSTKYIRKFFAIDKIYTHIHLDTTHNLRRFTV